MSKFICIKTINNIYESSNQLEINANKAILAIIGSKKEIDIVLEKINDKKTATSITQADFYIPHKVINPIINVCEKIKNEYGLANINTHRNFVDITISILCNCESIDEENNIFTILKISQSANSHVISYPECHLESKNKGDRVVDISDLVTKNINKTIPINISKKNIEFIGILREELDTLVYVAKNEKN